MSEPKLAQVPEPENLAEVIRKVSDAFDRLLRSGLNQHAIVTLLAYDTKVSRREIEKVLGGLRELARQYVVGKK